jgi:hypothetical protein
MKRIYIKEDNIIVENEEHIIEGELCSLDDVEFGLCCGIELEYNIVYEIAEGYLMLAWDDYLIEFDYILTKK